jgi:ribosomal protein S18 acetylase RimI-like enzyme
LPDVLFALKLDLRGSVLRARLDLAAAPLCSEGRERANYCRDPRPDADETMAEPILARGFDERDRERIVALLREYEAGIGVSLCFQSFDAELARLPGEYAPPGGEVVLAWDGSDGDLLGFVAVRPVPGSPGVCEMKRLYVRPAGRRMGLGRKLALAAISEARRLGYVRMCLDTLPSMTAAQDLYRALGFCHTGVSQTAPQVLLYERSLEGLS